MTQKKRGLGRGLESLLSPNFDTAAAPASELIELAIDTLRPGRYQPRRDIDTEALEALAQSIRAQGIVQPLVVRAAGEAYEIIAGERRWRAARLAALTTVPAVIRELTDETAMAVTLIENIQREDLNPLEESVALRRLIDECGLTHAACAEAIGRSRAAVSNLLRLADLNADVRDHLWEGALEMGHARALLALTGEAQSQVAHQVVTRGLSVRQTEALVRATASGAPARAPAPPCDAGLQQAEADLARRLAAGVRVEPDRRGGGRVIIRFRSAEELAALVARFDA